MDVPMTSPVVTSPVGITQHTTLMFEGFIRRAENSSVWHRDVPQSSPHMLCISLGEHATRHSMAHQRGSVKFDPESARASNLILESWEERLSTASGNGSRDQTMLSHGYRMEVSQQGDVRDQIDQTTIDPRPQHLPRTLSKPRSELMLDWKVVRPTKPPPL